MSKKDLITGVLPFMLFILLQGCAGKPTPLTMKDPTTIPSGEKKIVFPNGLITGGESSVQATELAKLLVSSHNMAVKQRERMEHSIAKNAEELQRLEEKYYKNMATVHAILDILEKKAQKQGPGMITIFFPVNRYDIPEGSFEYQRLVRFLDFIARDSHGRKVVFVLVGSASAFGSEKLNEALARKRAEAPVRIIDRYLVNIPHRFYKIYGTGDLNSPRNVSKEVHDRYQHVRITAVYEGPGKEEEAGLGVHAVTVPGLAGTAGQGRSKLPVRPTGFTNSLGMKFVYIPPGSFIMGSPSNEYGHDLLEIQHRVTISEGFYLQTTEVTQGQWKSLMGTNPAFFSNGGDDYPVERVNWYDIQKFIAKLNKKEGTLRYRLPTEAEWEYACRAGTTTAFSNGGTISEKSYGYNQSLDKIAWYYGNSQEGTHPVAKKKPNAWGLYDMHGNVWEYCQDWMAKYPFNAVTDPKGPPMGVSRIRRGGSWREYPVFCRAAYRSAVYPKTRDPDLGFRLAVSLKEPSVRKEKPIGQAAPALRESKKPCIPVEECMIIRDITFDFDSATIRKAMIPVMDRAVEILKDRSEDILLEGHTCNIGSEAYNLSLSNRRAAAIKTYLVNRGIPASRIRTIGYGESRPKYDNNTEAGRRLNRRVEIHLIPK